MLVTFKRDRSDFETSQGNNESRRDYQARRHNELIAAKVHELAEAHAWLRKAKAARARGDHAMHDFILKTQLQFV
jgi:hypothetical protein